MKQSSQMMAVCLTWSMVFSGFSLAMYFMPSGPAAAALVCMNVAFFVASITQLLVAQAKKIEELEAKLTEKATPPATDHTPAPAP
jgi:Na+-transporting NADH:ubiquinone oxidoreductase subunit NqrB